MAQMWSYLPLALLVCLGSGVLVRKNVERLSSQDILNLQTALQQVKDDNSSKGYQAIAGYHGYPPQCEHDGHPVACCVHGDLNFPTWHRLLVVQVEQALKEKGLSIGVPYWDWTEQLHHLPDIVSQSVFFDSAGGKTRKNAWYRGDIQKGNKVVHTARAVDQRLYQQVPDGEHTDLFEHVLHAFEYESYCDFEVQFEVAHSTIHSLVGGRYPYSLSTLEYTVYDPIFFLHHSNVDRLLNVYQAIQQRRGLQVGPNTALCDIKGYFSPLEPFSRASNPFSLTRINSSPDKARDSAAFGYEYDSLTVDGLDVDHILELIKERQSHDRAFADFRLHNIGLSADVRVKVCLDHAEEDDSDDECEYAGDFFLLGGPLEMDWSFAKPFHFEITKTVQKLGVPLEGNYHVEAEIYSVNGTRLQSSILPHPSVSYRPHAGHQDPVIEHSGADHEHEAHDNVVVRKNADRLTREEVFELREALQEFQNDKSIEGFQAIAEFHGDPGKCPYPTSNERIACCVHGMPNFPHWHRLLVAQVEDALRRRGATIGVPYWDITQPNAHIPLLAADEKYTNPITGEEQHNPFHDANIAFLGPEVRTERDILDGLSQSPSWGHNTELFNAFILALEQDNFCDFEVQFEVAHNLIHALVGGNTTYGLSSLSYSAFDPIFYIYHSNIDRIWAIWTALQQHRKKPYKAHCAQSYIHLPLKPFAFKPPYNNDPKTYSHSTPTNIYDYERELNYVYDNLEFGGFSIPELDDYINNNVRNRFRIFVGVQLHGIKKSGLAHIYITPPGQEKYEAGRFALLGGPSEGAWRFDREYQHDITAAIEHLQLHWAQPYNITIEMAEFDGTPIDTAQFGHIDISYEPNYKPPHHEEEHPDDRHIRKNVNRLTSEEILDLRHALTYLEEDKSVRGYQTLGRYHGSIQWCPKPSAVQKFACCPHGMPTFPHWHRLLTVQAENALRNHGLHGALPYWDWTQPLTSLPEIVLPNEYTDPSNGKTEHNPFHDAHIDDVNENTVRSVRNELFQQPAFGEYTDIARQVLLAFEQDDFCKFETQFEIAHNYIHALVGGSEPYSMASLVYTAYDPLFYLHHSNTDRLWAIWQALQKYRGKAYNTAHCAISLLGKPLAPFSLSADVNPDNVTRAHATPQETFDYKKSFHYEYDNLEFNGLTIPQLARVLEQNKANDRVFAGIMLHGIKTSALIKIFINTPGENSTENFAGEFYILGDEHELAWVYYRLFKYEITSQLDRLHLHYDDNYSVTYKILDLKGNDLGQQFPAPTVVHEIGTSHIYGQEYRPEVNVASQIRRNLKDLSQGEVESLRSAFLDIQRDHSYENIAAYHGQPALCEHEGRKVACCVHGSPAFPSWHRLYVELVEHQLLRHGSSVAVPYWDWVSPITKLPKLISKATYFNSRENRFDPNPFFSGKIAGENAVTTRDPQPELFNNSYFYEEVLNALEQEHFCDFEIQLEIVHNALHSWLGGHARYSMSSLDYAAFDPVFFLHHANTDRLWAIWQELQRYRGLPYNEADCAINLMRKPLGPFNSDSNKDELVKKYSRPADTFDYRNNFHYEYDNLELNGLSIPELDELIHSRQQHGRVFAGFLLHNIGLSAEVDVYICVQRAHGDQSCNHRAGGFAILGGETEMPFQFDRLYKLEITQAVRDLGLKLDNAANFRLKVDIRAANGSHLSPNTLHEPSIIYVPGTDEVQEEDGTVSNVLVRKNIDSLSPLEGYSLVKALIALKADNSADGFQSIASFHAIPPLCPSPTASERHACCIHGQASFLQWHRLYTVQFEDALKRHGASVGVPYWDWTRVTHELPRILHAINYTDLFTGVFTINPFSSGEIQFENTHIERDVQDEELFKRGPHGWDTWLYNQILFALEQEDFCDFAIQLEIAHNAIHSWIGGNKIHSLAHLHYASYDPAFYIHHSNTDRLWAVWQALQQHRGHKPNEANCALEQLRVPLKPFSFGPPYNLNSVTREFSRPQDTFDYEAHFHYHYDALEFVGMSIPTLNTYIRERQEHDRVFAGFLLSGLGVSANVNFQICNAEEDRCFDAGHFTILGGSAEMEWQADRLYKYEITDKLREHDLRYDDDYHFVVTVVTIEGNELSNAIHEPTVIFVPAKHDVTLKKVTTNRIRRNWLSLDNRDIQSVQAALRSIQNDNSTNGWATLSSFHGSPPRCPDPEHPVVACCQHGMPTFPHWHRLFTLQVELSLQAHGSSIAIPYWDWTLPIKSLPALFTNVDYYDPWHDEVYENPFAHGYIPDEAAYTVRDIQPELYETTKDGEHSALFPLVLEALEQTNYCDFEVHYEVIHNYIHYLVGGHQRYSLSSLEYSAYDPLFYIHHSFVDKLWIVWQELQQRRHLPYHRADCAVNAMNEPLKPFIFDTLNPNKFTRDHALPSTLFDHENLGYAYDDLQIGNHNLDELEALIHQNQQHARVFAGFMLKGIKTSASIKIKICKADKCTNAGQFNLLGGPLESPWAYHRLYRREVTQYLDALDLHPEDVFDPTLNVHVEVEIQDVTGKVIPSNRRPTLIFDPAHGGAEDVASTSIAGVGVRKEVSHLSSSEISNLRDALRRVQEDSGPNGFQSIASYHGYPGRCQHNGQPVACCVHGSPNFPQWHRLYVKQWEDALTAHGARIGIPYWDWTKAFKALPSLVTLPNNNPFHHGEIGDLHITTTREPRERLFNDPEFGDESFFYRQVLLAFEQTDYCDFEIQFEITHNAIHSWVGGPSPHGLSTLDYTAYDPLFLLHHSNVDRQFAIWQALQKHRGLPYNSANCAIQELHQPLRPFSDANNTNPTTHSNARAIDVFDYDRLHYQYDDLDFHGLSIPELEDVLEQRQEQDRIFVDFLLHNISTSADINFELCDEEGHCEFAGTFAVLGGPLEMNWEFDRLFKYDVTNVFKKLHLQHDSEYHFVNHIVAVNGTELRSTLIRSPSVQFVPGVKKYHGPSKKVPYHPEYLLRKNVNQLSLREATSLKDALHKLQQDQGPGGFEAIAGFHGAPFLCPQQGAEKYACCVHGMPVFPHWHRLFTVQFEQALKEHGSHAGIPYWDWTAPGDELPTFFADTGSENPFNSYDISFAGHRTTRSPLAALFSTNTSDGHNLLYDLTLDALEEEDFCHFEVMLEFLHNRIHFLIGGDGTYSMSTLDYSAFDPIFMIVHSGMDRLWVHWQELQKLRRKPFVAINCGEKSLHSPLHPFDYEGVNTIQLTRDNALPDKLFDHHHLGYEYDSTRINGHDAHETLEIIRKRHSETRVYLGGAALGIGQSVRTEVWVLDKDGVQFSTGTNFMLGSSKEMPWSNEILWKFDITDAVHKAGVPTDKNILFHFKIETYNNSLIADAKDYAIFAIREAYTDYLTLNIPVGVSYPLPSKLVVPKGTHIRFLPVSDEYSEPLENLVSYSNFYRCTVPPFSFSSFAQNVIHALAPGDYYFASTNKAHCEAGRRIYVEVQDH